ncbi:MAG: hypothetical protein AAB296_01535, partial [Candidatus Desantisbacteria bacterium]
MPSWKWQAIHIKPRTRWVVNYPASLAKRKPMDILQVDLGERPGFTGKDACATGTGNCPAQLLQSEFRLSPNDIIQVIAVSTSDTVSIPGTGMETFIRKGCGMDANNS